jgi:hypothetical protein
MRYEEIESPFTLNPKRRAQQMMVGKICFELFGPNRVFFPDHNVIFPDGYEHCREKIIQAVQGDYLEAARITTEIFQFQISDLASRSVVHLFITMLNVERYYKWPLPSLVMNVAEHQKHHLQVMENIVAGQRMKLKMLRANVEKNHPTKVPEVIMEWMTTEENFYSSVIKELGRSSRDVNNKEYKKTYSANPTTFAEQFQLLLVKLGRPTATTPGRGPAPEAPTPGANE